MGSKSDQTNSGKNSLQNHRTWRHHVWILKSLNPKFLEEGRSLQGSVRTGLFCSQIHSASAKGHWGSRIMDKKVLYFDHSHDKSELNIAQFQPVSSAQMSPGIWSLLHYSANNTTYASLIFNSRILRAVRKQKTQRFWVYFKNFKK